MGAVYSLFSQKRYQKIPSRNLKETADQKAYWASTVIVGLFILTIGAGLGFLGAKYTSQLLPSDSLLSPAGISKQVWHYNQTFAKSPSRESEAAWMSMFPRGRGFFSHPDVKANVSLISVFHELHCLSGIRLAYYAALNETYVASYYMGTEDSKSDALNAHTDSHHVHHCFDYLRQALMCAADTNLETYDWNLGGSTGWGEERRCRDYDGVVAWADKWRHRF